MIDPRFRTAIQNALSTARHLPVARSTPALSPPSPPPDLSAHFAAEWQALGGVFFAAPAADVPTLLLRLSAERQATHLLSWRAEHLPIPALLDTLRQAGIEIEHGELPVAEPERAQRLRDIETITVGLTGVEAVLAEPGTLALSAGAGRPRLASLSVRTHIALFKPDQVYASWAAWWAVQSAHNLLRSTSNLTLITGPSRTADIEMTLTVGVHGPKDTIAIWVQP